MAGTRLRLLPGLPVLRRDERHLQVGLEPGRAVVLPDEPGVRRVLAEARAGGVHPDGPHATDHPAARALQVLAEAGLITDPADLAARHLARAACLVEVDASADVRARVLPVLAAAGLAAHRGEPADRPDPSVRLVVREGVVPRSGLDDAARDGLPHLVVGAQPGSVTVGPFVHPGVTACLRCLDAHRAAADPRWPLLVEQAGQAGSRGQAGRLPVDPLLQHLALVWAAADLRAWAEGARPSTWSASVRFAGADGTAPTHERQEWTRHPGCGCAWGAALTTG
ncbi:hypothetical protein [Nocardioides pantholopis]|uniref:hypothetical protein n=1 Tax=Nocardioides pantholopis TaxID=2483798 RepID=UPI0013DD8A36|nr:hypothetical protein [Nocardioides pantholopis]